jgi:hypothetical protein
MVARQFWVAGAERGKTHQRPHGGQRRGNDLLYLEGRDLSTGGRFLLKATTGRCDSIWLQYGTSGLYYNASSHGTMTLTLEELDPSNLEAASDASDDEKEQKEQPASNPKPRLATSVASRVIIEGPHSRAPKDPAAWVGARRLSAALLLAAGRVRAADEATPAAWVDLLSEMGAGPAAHMLSVVHLPWLEQVRELNDCVWSDWQAKGFPTDPDALVDPARRVLRSQLGLPPEDE